jgi:hypothetical protein
VSGYKHGEAFCHMRYRADDGSEELSVWNSRDGVTPFVISLPSGKGATHVDWNQDRCDPTHVPEVGDWIFVDLTPERAREAAGRNAQRFWDDPTLPARQSFGSVEDLAELLLASYLEPRGGPDLVQVTEEVRTQLLGARKRPEMAGRSLGEGDVAASGRAIPADQGGEGDVTQIEDGPAAAERGGTSRHANPAGPTLDPLQEAAGAARTLRRIVGVSFRVPDSHLTEALNAVEAGAIALEAGSDRLAGLEVYAAELADLLGQLWDLDVLSELSTKVRAALQVEPPSRGWAVLEELELLRQVALLAPRPPWFKTDTQGYVRALERLDQARGR